MPDHEDELDDYYSTMPFSALVTCICLIGACAVVAVLAFF
jgi:hypothetical protein